MLVNRRNLWASKHGLRPSEALDLWNKEWSMSLKEILSEMSVPKKAADFLAMLFCFVLFFVFGYVFI